MPLCGDRCSPVQIVAVEKLFGKNSLHGVSLFGPTQFSACLLEQSTFVVHVTLFIVRGPAGVFADASFSRDSLQHMHIYVQLQ